MTKKISVSWIRPAFVLLWAVHAVHAQQGPILVAIPNPATMVLRSPVIAKQLTLNYRQTLAIDASLDRVEIELWKLSRDVSVQRNKTALALLGQLRVELSAVLSPFQSQRYQQILWQAQGIRSLLDAELALQVGLTPGQQQRITAVLTALQTTLSKTSPNQQALLKQARSAAQREGSAVLTGLQHERLRRLLGMPVDFSTVVQRAFEAPEFTGVTTWINSHALTRSELKGHVTVVHFYTYGCINCVRNLPHYNSWFDQFSDRPLRVVGIHRPETAGEHDIEAVRKKAFEAGIKYPVAVDNDSDNWNAWGNHAWPSVYLVDKQGFVRYWWYGELNWQGTPGENWMRNRIQALLKE